MHRYARQIRLAEIGPMGQAAFARRSVDVCLDGLAAEVAVRYLAGAGVGSLSVINAQLAEVAARVDRNIETHVDRGLPVEDIGAYDLLDPAAREVARGARFALRELKAALSPEGR